MPTMEFRTITRAELKELFDCSENALLYWINKGEVKSVFSGKFWRKVRARYHVDMVYAFVLKGTHLNKRLTVEKWTKFCKEWDFEYFEPKIAPITRTRRHKRPVPEHQQERVIPASIPNPGFTSLDTEENDLSLEEEIANLVQSMPARQNVVNRVITTADLLKQYTDLASITRDLCRECRLFNGNIPSRTVLRAESLLERNKRL